MKVLIFADMEGISSVVKMQETGTKESWWEKFRILLTNEVNAAVEGTRKAGATQIDVVDWHGGGINILPDKLHPDANLVRGANVIASLWDFVGKNSHDAAMIIGIHSQHGTAKGVLSHTMNGISEFQINGQMIGEIQMIAGFCGYYNIPVVVVSGDLAAVNEAKEHLGDVKSVITKEGLSFSGARCFNPDSVCKNIEKNAKSALKNIKSYKIFNFKNPMDVRIYFANICCCPEVTDLVSFIPTVEKIDEKTVSFKCNNIIEFLKVLIIISLVAGPVYTKMFK